MTTPSVSSPRTELRNLITDVQQQKLSEEAFSAQLIKKISEIIEKRLPYDSNLYNADYVSAQNQILTSFSQREKALNFQLRVLIKEYLDRNGDVEKLADAIFGQISSSEKQFFIRQSMTDQETLINSRWKRL